MESNQPSPLHNPIMPPYEEALQIQESCRARQHLEYQRKLEVDAAELDPPRLQKKAKGNNHKAQPHQTNPPADDELPHKRPISLPKGAHILNPGRASVSPKKTVHSPHKKPYIPYSPPAFQNQTRGKGVSPDASAPPTLHHVR